MSSRRPPEPLLAPPDGGEARRTVVVLVEDNEDSRAIYGTVLRRAGYLVVEAEDGAAGVQAVQNHLPELVVMDAGLPGLNGWEATAALKGDPRTAAVPVLVLTVHGQPTDLERAAAVGCDAYLLKPADPNVLAEKVERLIAGSRERRACATE